MDDTCPSSAVSPGRWGILGGGAREGLPTMQRHQLGAHTPWAAAFPLRCRVSLKSVVTVWRCRSNGWGGWACDQVLGLLGSCAQKLSLAHGPTWEVKVPTIQVPVTLSPCFQSGEVCGREDQGEDCPWAGGQEQSPSVAQQCGQDTARAGLCVSQVHTKAKIQKLGFLPGCLR